MDKLNNRAKQLVSLLREWSENSDSQLFMYDGTQCDQLCLVEDVESLFLEMQTQLKAAKERIKELEQALSEEIEICPSAKASNEEYCFRAKVCSICSNNRYIKELLLAQPKESE